MSMKTSLLSIALLALLAATTPVAIAHSPASLDNRYYPNSTGYDSSGSSLLVRRVQLALQKHGYYVGDNQGQFGMETRAAVRRYRRDHGLPIIGKIDQELLRSLGLS
jgi:peptidoglycan hydrolase-like protein with peptidoglycan-binding domain